MATVGEILKEERLKKNLSLEQVEKAIKIRESFLTSLEKGEYQRLPSHTYIRGFVKNYAEYLGLPIDSTLARLRRELDERTLRVLPKREDVGEFPTKRIRLTGAILLAAFFIILIFSYLFFQYRSFITAPRLIIESPSQNQTINESVLTISGQTDPDATVTINNEFVSLDKDGKFEKKMTVFKGDFTFTVVATNRFNKKTEMTRTVKIE